MTRFVGNYTYTIDSKGRINIPAKFRKALSPDADETFIVSLAPDNCLRAYPQDQWAAVEQDLDSRAEHRENTRLRRLIFGNLSSSKLDGQGRVTLLPNQIEAAGISKSVRLIGYPGYIEIWDTDRYEAYLSGGESFDDVFYKSVERNAKPQ
jgi:MraZ protein